MEKITAAKLLVQLRAPGTTRPAMLPPELAPQSEHDAYHVQSEVVELLGERVAGWKASMPDATRGLSAPIVSGNLLHSPGALADLAHPTEGTPVHGVEPEIAFCMGRSLPPRSDGRDYRRDEVLAAIASAHCGIEICACRVGGFHGGPPLERLADSIMNEGLVVGAALEHWRQLDLAHLSLRLRIDDVIVHEGVGGHPLGDPLIPMVWMANHLAARGQGLQAGQVVTTGSCAGMHQLRTGQRVQVEFTGLGGAVLQA